MINESPIITTIKVMDAIAGFSKTASEDKILNDINDTFIKIAENSAPDEIKFKVANLLLDTIQILGLEHDVDIDDFANKAATAETIYHKLASSDDVVERDMAEIAKLHINALFTKVAQIAVGIHPNYLRNVLHDYDDDAIGLYHQMNLERARARKLKDIATYGIPAAFGLGLTVPYLADKILGK